MLRRRPPPSRQPPPTDEAERRKRAAKREAMRRWRRNEREGRRLAGTPVSALVLCWLDRRYHGRCDLDDLADVGRLIGDILEASARADPFL
jgi:hypothetical protein